MREKRSLLHWFLDRRHQECVCLGVRSAVSCLATASYLYQIGSSIAVFFDAFLKKIAVAW